jgi:hypothetical protein
MARSRQQPRQILERCVSVCVRTTTTTTTVHHRLPPSVRLGLEHKTGFTRAYRLGKSEILWIFLCLLREQHYSPITLRRQIMGQLDYLDFAGPEALEIAENEWYYEEFLGRADACRTCLRWIDFEKLDGEPLDRHIADAMFAAWPPDYQEYRRRWGEYEARFPAQCATVCCLPLRDWYGIVDSLHREIYRTRRTGLPPSERQKALENLLLCRPGERMPCTE